MTALAFALCYLGTLAAIVFVWFWSADIDSDDGAQDALADLIIRVNALENAPASAPDDGLRAEVTELREAVDALTLQSGLKSRK
jgi:hypothetical protein